MTGGWVGGAVGLGAVVAGTVVVVVDRAVVEVAGEESVWPAVVAELMTEADLVGADAHGVFRLPQYVQRTQAGGFKKAA